MSILFISLVGMDNINERGIYSDLMRYFVQNGHSVTILSPIERRYGKKTYILESERCKIIRVRSLNIQKTNLIEKTAATFLIDYQLRNAIAKYVDLSTINLIIYTTPPITLVHTIRYCKSQSKARTYLLLKDIFPQNAVDMGFMGQTSFLYRYFRKKEKQLYALSDKIGCMSMANVQYILKENPEIPPSKVEENPNTIEPIPFLPTKEEQRAARQHFGLPLDKRIFIYGGNLGKPQGIDFILRFLEANKHHPNLYFVIIGTGTEYSKLEQWYQNVKPSSVLLLAGLPKNEYDRLLQCADIGMIFLDYRFKIPNFPSRLLSYLEQGMPVIAATDPNTDIGQIIEDNQLGKWVLSNDLEQINAVIYAFETMSDEEMAKMGKNARRLLEEKYLVEVSYQQLIA
jgi:glycosyltransferase involved in cell wall biosynthesis